MNALRTTRITLSMIGIIVLSVSATHAQPDTQEEMRSLDAQVQEIKSDVLGIARDLGMLEERLLYPSNSHFAVFVALQQGAHFRLDAVRLEIDGDLVTHYIYDFKELEALENGGVQRVYTGNITTGAHDLTIAVDGKLANGEAFSSNHTFGFDKGVEPELLGLTLSAASGGAAVELSDW